MKLPEKTAFTLAEVAAQLEVDEETVIECWRQTLISFCLRWKHPEITARWYEHTENGISRQVKRDCIPCDELLRVPRAEVEAILAKGQSPSLNVYGFERLAVKDHEAKKADPFLEADGYMGPVFIHFEIADLIMTRNELLISREERDRFRATLDHGLPGPSLSRRERQVQAIMEAIKALGFKTDLGYGQVKRVKEHCLKNDSTLIGSVKAFDDAFREVKKQGLARYIG